MRKMFLISILLFSFSFQGKSTDSLFQQGLDHFMQDEFKKAQTDFLQDAKQQPSFSSFYNLGVAYGSLDEWSKAKWAFESSLKYEPLNGDAQFNAEFATQKLSDNEIWVHPYPWLERVVLGFGTTTWIVFVWVTSLSLGFLLFNIVSKNKSNVNRWHLRLILPVFLLFSISSFGVYSINKHFNTERYAIMKSPKTHFYISPNGVPVRDEVDPGSRLEVIKYFKDSTWVQVRSQENNYLWIESENVFTY